MARTFRSFTILALLLTAASGFAENVARTNSIPGYEQVLAPFDTVSIPGQLGSLFAAELWVRNDAAATVNLFPERCFFIGREFPCSTRIEVPAKTTRMLDVLPSASDLGTGIMFYVPADRVDTVHFGLRVRDVSRDLDTAGTEVPVVRERQFKTRTATLLNVPLGAGFRVKMRLYSLEPVSSYFIVRVYAHQSDQLLSEQAFSALLPTDQGVMVKPNMIDVTSALDAAVRSGVSPVRVTIERLHQNGRFWPLLSITSNSTQQITIVTPQ